MSLKSTRRDFLRHSMMAVGAIGFSELATARLFNKMAFAAFAEANQLSPNPGGYYFNISINGGPPRWFFDLPLTPSGKTATNFVAGGFGTAFSGSGSNMNVVYNTVQKSSGGQNIHLPPVWSYNTSKNFSSILDHCLFIRGMDMEINNHGLSNARQVAPIAGNISLSGVVADKSDRAIASITDNSSGAAQAFKSAKGLSPEVISTSSTGNVLTAALSTLTPQNQNRPHIAGQNLELQSQALTKLEEEMNRVGYSQNSIADSYQKAADLIDANTKNIANEYPNVYAKYNGLITEAFTVNKGSLAGIYDKVIPVNTSNTKFNVDNNTPASNIAFSDLRDMIHSGITVPRLAQNFAIMEILVHRLSTNFSVSVGSLSQIALSSSLKKDLTTDQHGTGVFCSTLVTTLYYRALLACLVEYVNHLKSLNIFDRSVIHISSEFNRTPRPDGSGSDHGPEGSNTTLISGKFTSAKVIGNVYKQRDGRGTWGVAAPYANFGRAIKVNDVARSVSAMLGVADVVNNGESLVVPGSGNLWTVKHTGSNSGANNV